MDSKKTVLLLKVVLWLCALAPATWLLAGWFFLNTLGANPIEKLTLVTGMTTLVLLLLTLSVTPLRRITGWNPLIKLRRPLGLFAFFYAFLHFSVWAGLDMTLVWEWMIEDITERPYITIGFTAFLILIPIAATSTTGWIRRLGKRWAMLHRGVYLATTLGVVHYFFKVKAGYGLPIFLAVCLATLLGWRIAAGARKRSRARAA